MKKKFSKLLIALIIVALLIGAIVLIASLLLKNGKPLRNSDMFADKAVELYGYHEDRDSDGDTLNDYEEHHTYQTNIFSSDTDSDGLYDNVELEKGTDPLKPDTDGDGILDGTEVRAGTDPLKKDSKVKLEREIKLKDSDTVFALKGNATIYDVVMEPFSVAGLSKTPGVISEACWIYSEDNKKGKLSMTIESCDEEISFYQLTDTTEFIKIDTKVVVDGEKTTLSATVGNGKYLVGVCSFLDKYKANSDMIDVFLLIDDSGSMYDEMMDGAGNDPEYKRIDMCRELLKNASDRIRFGLATFTADYMEKSGISESRDALFTELDTIEGTKYEDKEEQFTGTYIATSLYKALDNFNENSPRRQVLVILTDGETTEGKSIASWFDDTNSVKEVIEKADERNVSIITVALGHEVDVSYLSEIEEETDGTYIHANNADAMEDLYAAILNAVNYNYVDSDEDGEADEILLSDSGFDPQIHGFQFHNPIVSNGSYTSFGVCYGISTFTSLYYQEKLETSMPDVDEFDYDLWFLREVVGIFVDGIVQEEIPGYDVDTLRTAGINVSDDGKIIYDRPLGEWSTNESNSYQEFFDWEYESEFYDENRLYTDAATDILDEHDMIFPVEYSSEDGSISFPSYLIFLDEEDLSEDEIQTDAMLRLLWRHHFIQFLGVNDDHAYNMAEDLDVITKTVASGVPLVLCTSTHAVNVCKVRQDIDNPNQYYLDLYDSNHSGEPTTMTALIKYDENEEKYVEYTYDGETMTDITMYNIHVD